LPGSDSLISGAFQKQIALIIYFFSNIFEIWSDHNKAF